MNKRMLTTLQFVLLSLNIKGAAGNVQLKQKHVKRFAANLNENNQAHIDHKQPKTDVTYTTFHLANRKISVKNFLSLFQTLYGKTTQKKRFTIITIRSRNGRKTDNEDINSVNFITAMQKQLTGETQNSVVTNNLAVTVNVIEEDRIPDLDLLSTTNDTIASIYSKLSSLFISSITDILSIMFKQCLINHFFSRAYWLAQMHLENEGYTSPEQDFIDNWPRMPKTMQNEFNIFRIENYLTTVPSEFKAIIDKIHHEIVAFEQKIGLEYFTTNIEKCDRALDRMFDYFYVEVLRDSYIDLSPIAANIAGDQNHKEKLKTAFADGFKAILQHYKSKKASQKNAENIGSRDSEPSEGGGCYIETFNKFFYDFFETINFDQIKDRLPESHTKRFEKLKGELELPYTRIVYCGKIAIKNLPLMTDVLLEAKVFKDLNVRQTLYIEEDKVVNDDVRLLGDSTYGKKSFDLLNGYKYTVNANEKIEVYSKTKIAESELDMSASLGCTNPMRQNSTKNKTEGNKMSDELNTISIVEYADQLPEAKLKCIVGQLLDNIMKVNDSKFESLHELTVKCGLSLTDIYILRHVSNDLKTEKITVVCGDKEDFDIKTSERKKPKGNILCLDNIPLTILDDLYIYLSVLQNTNAPIFSFPNVWIANDSQIISTGKTVSSIHLINKTWSMYREYFKSGNAIDKHNMPKYVPMYNLLYYHKCKTYSGYEKSYIKKLGLQPADFDQIISKSVFNSGPCDTLSIDSFVNDDHRTTEKVEFYAMKPNKETTILYVVVRKNNNDLIDTFNYNIKVLENLLDNEKQNATLSDFTEIEKSHDMNIKLITLILNDLSKLKYFDISIEKWESTEETYKLDLLKRLDSFLNSNEHYGQVGKDSDNNSPSKPTLSSMFKSLLEQKIDELLKIIFEEKKKMMSQRIKISYFKIVKTGENIGGQFAESLRDMDYVEYRNLEMLDIKVEDEKKKPGRQINV